MSLQAYRRKRDFSRTSEPRGGKPSRHRPLFVVQEHWASHHHFDFRLEAFGTLKSWAVPKGPPSEVGQKRLAVEVEDHPIDYAKFSGRIPEGEYGAGRVRIWDRGTWVPPDHLKEHLRDGHLEFELEGEKLRGRWLLQRARRDPGGPGGRKGKDQWLLIKRQDVEPGKVLPQLALLVDQVPEGPQWLHELKLDGYRTIAVIRGHDVRLLTRDGLDWTARYRPFVDELRKLRVEDAILDGEIVHFGEKGRKSSFAALQRALSEHDLRRVSYVVFDLLSLNGKDVRAAPLEARKELLRRLLRRLRSGKVVLSPSLEGPGAEILEKACRQGQEGVVSKDRTQPYLPGRSAAWRKTKCSLRQELVIGGYTDPEGSRKGFGALLMGVREGRRLRYVGRVGTGFDATSLRELSERLGKLETRRSPFGEGGPKAAAGTHWVRPRLVAEVEFKSWTGAGLLRQASFQGLREDKPAREVGTDVAITHPERIIYPEAGITKLDVANYYKSVSPWLLKHLAGRPIALVRCPEKAGDACFFQKHVGHGISEQLREIAIRGQRAVFLDSERAVLDLAQWGVLEIHAWQCHAAAPLNPDQLIFDLDPGEGVAWGAVLRGAFRLRDLLARLKLKSFVKVTGSRGLHLHVPIAPVYSWEQAKAFAEATARLMESAFPGEYVARSSKKERAGKIYIDYLRNGFGATAVAPYSLRSRGRPTVAVPLAWSELRGLKGADAFDLRSTLDRLVRRREEPWPRYFALKQKLPAGG